MVQHNQLFKVPGTSDFLLYDAFLPHETPKGVVVFIHGFKGFKDWGAWHLAAKYFQEQGWAFFKFNFSHNGTSLKNPTEFLEPQKFRKNTYSKERLETLEFLDFLRSGTVFSSLKKLPIFLIGHSRGAGAAINAAQHISVKGVATWAGISKFQRWNEAQLLDWQKQGSIAIRNARTGEELPLDYGLITDYQKNRKLLRIKNHMTRMPLPIFIVHGLNDEAVTYKEALKLKKWGKKSELFLLEQANHVFGSYHPYPEMELPAHLKEIVEKTELFFRKNVH
jgi:predicted alpha/beta-hydrolase family hydrolase